MEKSNRTIAARIHHPAETWDAAVRDYLRGATGAQIEAVYGIRENTFRKRLHQRKITKAMGAPPLPPPIVAPPDSAQIDPLLQKSAWDRIAHKAQRPPTGDWRTWLFQGGRGAGKTRAGAEWLAARAEASPRALFALVGPTQHDVREVMVEGPSGLRNLPGRERPIYERSRRRLFWRNGAVAYAFSAEEPERLRGPQFEAAWADEFCVWPKPSETLALLRMGLRLGDDPRLVVTTTPKPITALRTLRAEPSCKITQAATRTNAANLTPTFLDGLADLYGGTRLAKQELEGLLVEDLSRALWRAEDFSRWRGARPDRLDSIVVGVDPAAGTEGSACGIVIVGERDKRGYILADYSVSGLSPLGWASRVAEAARHFGASAVIAEANQGGDMVRAMLASAGVSCAVHLVHASRGKRARAEPVSALYEQGRVTHCGDFPALEEELMALGAVEEGGTFDRADALVWAVTALLIDGANREGPRVSRV